MRRSHFTDIAYKALALALSALMVTSGVPAIAIAEAIDEVGQVVSGDAPAEDPQDPADTDPQAEPEGSEDLLDEGPDQAMTLAAEPDLVEAPELSDEELAELSAAAPVAVLADDSANPDADVPPTYADGTSIDSMSVSWITKDSEGHDDGDPSNLFYVPEGDDGFEVRMNVRFALSGSNDYEPGTIRLTIPKTVVRSHDGAELGSMTLSVPEAPSTRASFAYYETDDSYVLVNMVKLAASTPALFEFTQHDVTPHQVVGNPQRAVDGVSPATFGAKLEVTTPQGTLLARDGSVTATFDTAEGFKQGSGQMRSQANGGVYDTWQSSWPEALKPQNPEDYVFIDWYAWKYTEGNQSFSSALDFSITGDNPEGAYVLGVVAPDGTIVAGQPGKTSASAGNPAGVAYTDTLSAHAYVAVPRAAANDKARHNFGGKMTFSLTGVDDQTTVTADLSSSFAYQLKDLDLYRKPQRHYEARKYGNSYIEGALDKLASGKSVLSPYTVYAYLGAGSDVRDPAFDSEEDFLPGQVADATRFEATLTDDTLSTGGVAGALAADEYEYQQLDLSSAVTAYELVQTTEDGYALVTPNTSKEVAKGSWVYSALPAAMIPDLTVEAKTEAGEWVKVATVSYASGAPALSCEPATRTSVSGMRLLFDVNSSYVGVRLSLGAAARQIAPDGREVILGGAALRMAPTLRLRGASNSLHAKVMDLFARSETPSTSLTNTARVTASVTQRADWNGSASASNTLTGGATLKVNSTQEATYERDDANRRYGVSYTMTVHEKTGFRQKDNYDAAVAEGTVPAETSGTFYDLLPLGVYPDLSSVTLRKGDKVESVRAERNYKGSGRTLVVVEATLKPSATYVKDSYEDAPKITINGTYAYDDAAELGDNPVNVMAFESGNPELGTIAGWRGENNNAIVAGSTSYGNNDTAPAVEGLEDVLRGLNPQSTANTFVYSRTNGPVPSVDRSYVSTWQVTASANGDGQFSRGVDEPVNVYDGGAYSYQLRLINSQESGGLKGIVMYDALEAAAPNATNTGDATWHGTFAGVDVSALRAIGVEPVVYYCVSDVDLSQGSGHLDLSNAALWTTEAPEDLSLVKAVAIDASKAADGSDFTLGEGRTLSAVINMHAPRVAELAQEGEEPASYYDTDGEDEAGLPGGAHAYNAGVIVSKRTNGQDLWQESSQTKVGLAEYLLTVAKAWDDRDNSDSFRPGVLTVTLVANGKETTRTADLTEENGWKATFTDVPTADEKGEPIHYSVAESAAPGDGSLRAYYASQTEAVTSLAEPHHTVTDAFAIANYHDPDVTVVEGTKTWDDADDLAGKRPSSIKVNLYADGVLSKSQTVRPDADGVWAYAFEGLPVNRAANTPISYTVDEDYVPGYATSMDAAGNFTNTYDPYGVLYVSETLTGATQAALDRNPDFRFKVDVTHEDGSPDGERYSYTVLDADGNPTDVTGYIGSGETFSLKTGQTLRLEGIPSETSYKVTQVDDAGCALSSTSGEKGQVLAGAERACTAAFVNAYTSAGVADVSARKVLEGARLAAGQYTFQMYQDGVVVRTGFNDTDGTVLFGRLRYDQTDDGQDYTYVIRERQGSRGGVTYSTGEILVKVSVRDNGDGTMATTVTYSGGDGTVEQQAEGSEPKQLVNTYAASGDVTLTAWKTLENGTLVADQFAFTLEAEGEGTPMPAVTEAKNDASGSVQFGPIHFTDKECGASYTYIVREVVDPADTTTVYDDSYLKFTVTPKDGGDGTISFDQSVVRVAADGTESAVETPVFQNKAQDGSLRVEKYVKNGDPNTEFTFWLQLTGNEGQELPENVTPKLEQLNAADRPDLSQATTQAAPESASQKSGLLDTLSSWGKSVMDFFAPTVAEAEEIEGKLGTSEKSATYTYDSDTQIVTIHAGIVANPGTIYNIFYYYAKNIPSYQIKKIVFEEGTVITSGAGLFVDCSSLESVQGSATVQSRYLTEAFRGCKKLTDISGLSTWSFDGLERINGLFNGCSSLVDLSPLSGWNVSGVTSFSSVFRSCSKLESLEPLSNWDVSSVTSFSQCFMECTSITSLKGLNSWNMSRAVSLSEMFSGCKSLTDVNGISSWDTSSVQDLSKIFYNCSSLVSLQGLETWNTGVVRNLNSAFSSCSKLTNLSGLENWQVESVESIASLFAYCPQLSDLSGISTWNTSSVEDFSLSFSKCSSLTSLDYLSKWDISKGKTFEQMFRDCTFLSDISGLADWTYSSTSASVSLGQMFYQCSSLTTLSGLEGWNADAFCKTNYLFFGCSKLFDISALSSWNMKNVTNMSFMFYGCSALTSLEALSTWKTESLTALSGIFKGCKGIVSLSGIGAWNVGKVNFFSNCFSDCSSLADINSLRDWDLSSATSIEDLFNKYSSLTSLDALCDWDTSSLTTMNGAFEGCTNLGDVSALIDWDTSRVTNFGDLFANCDALSDPRVLSGWDVSAGTNFGYTFNGSGINFAPYWNVASATFMQGMFLNCRELVDISALNSWQTSNLTNISLMFDGCSVLRDFSPIASWDTSNISNFSRVFRICYAAESIDTSNWDFSSAANISQIFSGCKNLKKISIPQSLASFIRNNSSYNANWTNWFAYGPETYGPSASPGYTGKWTVEIGGIQSPDDTISGLNAGSKEACEYLVAHQGDLPVTFVWQRSATSTGISFDPNGGAGSMTDYVWERFDSKNVPQGTALPAKGVYWFDHEFLGWNTKSDGTGTSYSDQAVIDANDENFPVGSTVTLYAQWQENDHTVTKTDRGYKIVLGGNQAATVTGLPAGAGYQLYEETPAGWVLVGSRNASGTIAAGQTSTATFVNGYQPKKAVASIQATKTLDDAPAADGAYSFELYSVADDGSKTLLEAVSNGAGGSVSFSPIEYTAVGTYKYVVKEVAGADDSVTYDLADRNVTVTVTDEGGVLASSVSYDGADVLPVFKNTSKKASLVVSKQVVGTADTSKEFTFQVKVGQDVPQTVKLRAGESQSIEGIKVGTSYSVTETNLPAGYAADRAFFDGTVGVHGSTVTVVNRYSAAPATVGVTAKKVLEGATLAAGAFKFGLFAPGAAADAEPLAVAYNDAMGDVTFSPVSVSSTGELEVREISEASNADVSYDAVSSRQVHVAVADNGDGTMSAVQDGDAPVFTNTMKTATLTVSNALRDATAASRGTSFTYTLTVTDESGNALSDLPISIGGSTGTVSSGQTFTLGDGQTAQITLPSRCRYSVAQADVEGFATESSGSAGTLDLREGGAALASFVNTYKATGSFVPSVTKVLKGGELAAGQFSFELRDGEGGFLASAKNAADGSVEFPQVVFDQADFADASTRELAYTVQEVASGQDGVMDDLAPIQIAVTVTDDGRGHLNAVAVYTKDGQTGEDTSTVTNSRTADLPQTGRSGISVGVGIGLCIVVASSLAAFRRRRRR